MVLSLLTGEKTQAEICRLHELSPTLLSLWKETFLKNAGAAFQSREETSQEAARRAAHVGERDAQKGAEYLAPTAGERRLLVKHLHEEKPSWPVAKLGTLLGVPRSSLYSQSAARGQDTLRPALLKVAGEWPRYGARRLTAQLKREGAEVGERRVRRLMRELNLTAKPPPRKVRTTNSAHCLPRFPNRVAGLEVTQPEQVWVEDITAVELRQEMVYLAVVMDRFTRSIRGWCLSRRLDADLALIALARALEKGTPSIHQGVQYASRAYVARLQQKGAAISMAAVGCPEENGAAGHPLGVADADHQGRARLLERVSRLRGRALPDRPFPHRGLPEEAHPLRARPPHPGGVRGALATGTPLTHPKTCPGIRSQYTALTIAQAFNHRKIVQLLKNWGAK